MDFQKCFENFVKHKETSNESKDKELNFGNSNSTKNNTETENKKKYRNLEINLENCICTSTCNHGRKVKTVDNFVNIQASLPVTYFEIPIRSVWLEENSLLVTIPKDSEIFVQKN